MTKCVEQFSVGAFSFSLFVFLVIPCAANTITVAYTGDITFSQVAGISLNDTFTGSVTYSDPESGFFTLPGLTFWGMSAPDQIELKADGFDFAYSAGSLSNNEIAQILDTTQDRFDVSAGTGGSGFTTNWPFSSVAQLSTQFVWPKGTLSPAMLPDPLNVADLQLGPMIGSESFASMFLANGEGISGLITSAEVVPEPASGSLLAALLLACASASHLARRTQLRKREDKSSLP
jgi:hypothetical protein